MLVVSRCMMHAVSLILIKSDQNSARTDILARMLRLRLSLISLQSRDSNPSPWQPKPLHFSLLRQHHYHPKFNVPQGIWVDVWPNIDMGEPLITSLFGRILRKAPPDVAKLFFEHPSVSGSARAQVEKHDGPIPHDSHIVVVPRPRSSLLSLLHMALVREYCYSEDLFATLLSNPALSPPADVNMWSSTKNANGVPEAVFGNVLRPLPLLLTCVLLGPSRWGAALRILRHPTLNANHLNYFLPLGAPDADDHEDRPASSSTGPRTEMALPCQPIDEMLGSTGCTTTSVDHARAIRAAVAALAEQGEHEGSQSLTGHLALGFRPALKGDGCSALTLLLASCDVDGVDAEDATEAAPVVRAILEHPLLNADMVTGQEEGAGHTTLVKLVEGATNVFPTHAERAELVKRLQEKFAVQ